MTIGGVKLRFSKINCSTISKIERMGLPIQEFDKQPIAFCVAWVAASNRMTFAQATELIHNHLNTKNGINDILELIDTATRAINRAVERAKTKGL